MEDRKFFEAWKEEGSELVRFDEELGMTKRIAGEQAGGGG